jgi:hypothetical protein
MNYFPISVQLPENLHIRLAKTADAMGINQQSFVVTALEEILEMVDQRGTTKIPLFVILARLCRNSERKRRAWKNNRT